jgi:Cdc6-like AAA superfamily ATPase
MSQSSQFGFSAYITDRTRDFVGREWVFAEIDRWLADSDAPRYFIITGEPGIGKTAIAMRLMRLSLSLEGAA